MLIDTKVTIQKLLKTFDLEECTPLADLIHDCTLKDKMLRPSSLIILEQAQVYVTAEVKAPLLPLHNILGSGPGGYRLQCFLRLSDDLDDPKMYGSQASKNQRANIVNRLKLLCFDGVKDVFYQYVHSIETALHLLILLDEQDKFARVMESKKVCNERWKNSLWTPLHVAAQEGKVDMVNLLVESKAAPPLDSKDIHGRVAMDYANDGNYKDVVEILHRKHEEIKQKQQDSNQKREEANLVVI